MRYTNRGHVGHSAVVPWVKRKIVSTLTWPQGEPTGESTGLIPPHFHINCILQAASDLTGGSQPSKTPRKLSSFYMTENAYLERS